MSVKRRTFIFGALALLVWALLASLVGAYYYSSYNDLLQKTQSTIIHVNLGLNYGNGTVQWFNQTEAKGGDALLGITMNVAKVNYTAYSTGAFVTSINNVKNTLTTSWMWWTWSKRFWSLGNVGSDTYPLGDNETVYWYYENVMTWPPNAPP